VRHSWGKRSWWKSFSELVGLGSTQTCARCGARTRVVRPTKILPGRRRPGVKTTRWFSAPGHTAFWRIERVPPCG
jgi:hypothetical protein